jgi:hypothetical protein
VHVPGESDAWALQSIHVPVRVLGVLVIPAGMAGHDMSARDRKVQLHFGALHQGAMNFSRAVALWDARTRVPVVHQKIT